MVIRTVVSRYSAHVLYRYCIPMDKLDRAIQRSEEKFFDECDPGNGKLPPISAFLNWCEWSAQFLL